MTPVVVDAILCFCALVILLYFLFGGPLRKKIILQCWDPSSDLASHDQLTRACLCWMCRCCTIGHQCQERIVLFQNLLCRLHCSFHFAIALWKVRTRRRLPESVRLCEDSELVRGELSSIVCDNFVWNAPVSKYVLRFTDCLSTCHVCEVCYLNIS